MTSLTQMCEMNSTQWIRFCSWVGGRCNCSSLYEGYQKIKADRDFRLPPQSWGDLRSSGILRSVQWQILLLLLATSQPRRAQFSSKLFLCLNKYAMKTCVGNGGITPGFLDLGTIRRRMVCLRHTPLYTPQAWGENKQRNQPSRSVSLLALLEM